MPAKLTRSETCWIEDHTARLERMTAALDDDLEGVDQVEWSLFWRDMRRLYTRTTITLQTALETHDRKCLATGQTLWRRIEDRLVSADHRLHG